MLGPSACAFQKTPDVVVGGSCADRPSINDFLHFACYDCSTMGNDLSLLTLTDKKALVIRQRTEIAELFGFETRNKYEITDDNGMTIAFAAEQSRSLLGFIFRQIFGHWRRFDILIFTPQRQPIYRAKNRFRIWFTRIEATKMDETKLGAIQKRFSFFSKRFDIEDGLGKVLMTVRSPFWRIWTFPVKAGGQEKAVIRKKWSGAVTELLLDKDRFRIDFTDPELSQDHRALLLVTALFIDLEYFETKA